MKYFNAGYTSIIKLNDVVSKPNFIYTPSTCINDTFPDCWAFYWVNTEAKEIENVKKYLKTDIVSLQTEIDNYDKMNEFNWPNLFSDVHIMYQFNNKHFNYSVELVEIGLSIPEIELEEIIKFLTPDSDNIGECGMLKSLRNRIETTNNSFFGFDIIGIEYGYSLHSFHCNNLQKEYEKRFNIKLNKFGLINTVEECMKVIDWTNSNDANAEPVPWFICRIDNKGNK